MSKRYSLRLFLTIVAGIAACGVAQAATVPLSDLLEDSHPGATFTSGDKVFSKFTYDATGDNPSAEGVNVIDIQDANGNYGVRFQGGFVDQVGGASSDALITFDVTVAEGLDLEISEVYLQANPAVFGGPGLASVTETLLPDVVDKKLVMYDFGGGDDQLTDVVVLSQTFKTLSVQKDIILHATGNPDLGEGGAVTMSFVDQTFRQIPEPSSLALIALGMLSVWCLRRRS